MIALGNQCAAAAAALAVDIVGVFLLGSHHLSTACTQATQHSRWLPACARHHAGRVDYRLQWIIVICTSKQVCRNCKLHDENAMVSMPQDTQEKVRRLQEPVQAVYMCHLKFNLNLDF